MSHVALQVRAQAVYLTAHVAGGSINASTASARLAAENVARVLSGGRPHYAVNPNILERR